MLAGVICSAGLFAQGKKDSKKKSDEQTETVEEKTVVTILNALKSSNKKGKDKDDDLILFEGNVKISVEKGQAKTIISAEQISYSRKHEMLYAEGSVNLEQTDKSGSVSNISATSVLFNTSTLEGIFDSGRIIQAETNSLNLPSGSTLVVGSEVFARNHSGTIAFKKGELTFCNDEHPHWKIKASRIWLLPGNEFAFFNAVLFMDNIPVFYLPAFYYPKDELVFNPVFAYKNRQGFTIQTTTYLYGRKGLEEVTSGSSTSSDNDMAKYFNFVKPTKLMDQELQGIVLHNLDTPYTGDTSTYAKIMLDWYSNLGFGAGFDTKFKPKKIFNQIEAGFLFGFGNTIYRSGNPVVYLPFDSSGTRHYETSNFMGVEIPFRYRAFFKIGISEPLSLTLTLPIYSDPYFNYDYGDRKETMDWISYLLNNPIAEKTNLTEQQKLDSAEITSFTWDLSGNYSVNLPDAIKPYINTLSISSFSSSIVFSSKTESQRDSNGNPQPIYYNNQMPNQRKFFYPSQITPFKTNLSISGTLVSIGKSSSSSNKQITYPVPLTPNDILLTEAEVKKREEGEKEDSKSTETQDTAKKGFNFEKDGLPLIEFTPDTESSSTQDFTFDLTYTISPDFVSQLTYSPEKLDVASDFKWDKIQSSYIAVKFPITLNDTLTFKNSFVSMNNSFTFSPSYQSHPYISTDPSAGGFTDPNTVASMKKADYSATSMEIANTNRISIKPFAYYPTFKDTGISYNTGIKFLRTKFVGDENNPQWDTLTVDWDNEDSITQHSLDLTLAASELGGDFKQSLTITSTLPPQVSKYYGTLKLDFPFVNLTFDCGVSQRSKTDKDWKTEPFRQGLTVSLFDKKLNFSESYNYDTEKGYSDSLKLALSYQGFQAAYTMKYTNPYDFGSNGWIQQSEQEFLPYSASIAYSTPSKTFRTWKNRISVAPVLSTSLVVDFIRPTNSYFIFQPGITFKINSFLDITFSATSRNDVLYRYVQSALGHPDRIPGEQNIFVDLMNSFRFDDESLRKASGFKLKSLNFTITHDLHDWDLKSEFKIEPRLVTDSNGSKRYDFNPYFSISIVWRPMEGMKAEVLDEYGEWKLK